MVLDSRENKSKAVADNVRKKASETVMDDLEKEGARR